MIDDYVFNRNLSRDNYCVFVYRLDICHGCQIIIVITIEATRIVPRSETPSGLKAARVEMQASFISDRIDHRRARSKRSYEKVSGNFLR